MTKIKKFIISGLFAAMLCFSGADSVAAISNTDLYYQMQNIQRQILLLRIQYIQARIAELQKQLKDLLANTYVDIIYPNGGEKLENHNCYDIRWDSKNVENVTIKWEANGEERVLVNSTPASDGKFKWCTGNVSGDDFRIRISDAAKSSVSSESSSDFLVFDNSDGQHCSDGTVFWKCSTDKPKLCFGDMGLVDACNNCGCPDGLSCKSDSKCR
jgi:hypothetical protein